MHLGRADSGKRWAVLLSAIHSVSNNLKTKPQNKPMTPPREPLEALPPFIAKVTQFVLEAKGSKKPVIYYNENLTEITISGRAKYKVKYHEERTRGLNRDEGLQFYEKVDGKWAQIYNNKLDLSDPHSDEYSKETGAFYKAKADKTFRTFITHKQANKPEIYYDAQLKEVGEAAATYLVEFAGSAVPPKHSIQVKFYQKENAGTEWQNVHSKNYALNSKEKPTLQYYRTAASDLFRNWKQKQ